MKPTDISQKVRDEVYLRDSYDGVPCCVVCGSPMVQVHHYIERSRGGRGIPENLVCLCFRCHRILHDTGDKSIEDTIRNHLMKCYPDWDEKKLNKSRWEK